MTPIDPAPPPGAIPPIHSAAARVRKPLEQFLHVQTASGILLLGASVIALVWANSPLSHAYESLWHVPVGIGAGSFRLEQSLHFWVNEGLMTIFFLVVGLEIRREMHAGELSEPRRAALPVVAAIGGMIAPALIYAAFNRGAPTLSGWGVPMATDIAFALGVLTALGPRVPPALRVLLLALAIIDDVGAILVIAIFYSSGVSGSGLLIAAAGLALTILVRGAGVRRAAFYVPFGAIVWYGFFKAGIHPTLAGVLLGLLTPARPWFGSEGFVRVARHAIEEITTRDRERTTDSHELLDALSKVGEARREAVSPIARLEFMLHPWVAYGIMPLFALANAGVALGGVDFAHAETPIIGLGVVLGLAVGKPVGIAGASYLAVRLGLCALPRGVRWGGVWVVGMVGGIGFTMALFIAALAFTDPIRLNTAKLSVLAGSVSSAVFALVAARWLLPSRVTEGARTVDEAEQSTVD